MNASERELLWLRKVRDLSQRLASERDLGELLPKILDAAIEITEAERGYLVLVQQTEEGKRKLKIVQARGFDGAEVPSEGVKLSRTVVQRVLEREERGLVTTSEEDKDVVDVPSVKNRKVLSIICVPMRLRGETRGILYLDSRFSRDAFTASDLPILRTFADQAALATETAELLAGGEGGALAAIESLRSQDDARDEGKAVGERPTRFGELVGASAAMAALYEEVERAGRSWDTVLLLGEQGAGLSAVAAEVHRRSERSAEPFLTLDCATADPKTLESELFGHRKGALPWATSDRRGQFVLAGKGTLVLENVDALAPELQARALRVLREEKVTPVGGTKAHTVFARVIATSHADLAQRVKDGAFRSDLYYQLDVLRLIVPPLRQRPEDVPLLVAEFATQLERPALRVSEKAMDHLSTYRWPGNVRELRNEVRRLVQRKGEITTPMLSPEIQEGVGVAAGSDSPHLGKTLAEVEREMVTAALAAAKGVKSRAARQLGIPRTTLYHLIERFGLGD